MFECQKDNFLIYQEDNKNEDSYLFLIKVTFWLTSLFFLNGVEEDMDWDVNMTPTSCNIDSNANT